MNNIKKRNNKLKLYKWLIPLAIFILLGLSVLLVGVTVRNANAYGYTTTIYQEPYIAEQSEEYFAYGIEPLSCSPGVSIAYGGDMIFNFWRPRGTIGINAVCNETGRFGILTNAHVALNDVMYHGREGGFLGTRIGRAVPEQSIYDRASRGLDVAFVPFQNQNGWRITPHVRYGGQVFTNVRLCTRYWDHGGRIKKIGQRTGITTNGLILDRRVNDFSFNNLSGPGDSGGPVFRYFPSRPNDLYLRGIFSHFYPNADDPNAPQIGGWATCIVSTMRELRITPITNDNYYLFRHGTFTDIPGTNNVEFTGFGSNPRPGGHLTIPSVVRNRTVTHIADNAFANSPNLTSIYIPNTVTTIGNSAFANTGITNFTIPSSVTTIGSHAFTNTGITNITIPAATTYISNSAFWGTPNLTYIFVTAGNPRYLSQNGILYRRESTIKFVHVPTRVRGNIVIPLHVAAIPASAFADNNYITHVSIPHTVMQIGFGAFSAVNPNLSITWGYNPHLDRSAVNIIAPFLTRADIGFDPVTGLFVQSVRPYVFNNAARLREFTVHPFSHIFSPYFTVIDGVLYSGQANNKTLVRYPIAKTTANFRMPAGVRAIGDYAFAGARSLMRINLGNSNWSYLTGRSIGNFAFAWTGLVGTIHIAHSLASAMNGHMGIRVFEGSYGVSRIIIDCYASSQSWGCGDLGNWLGSNNALVVWSRSNEILDNSIPFTPIEGRTPLRAVRHEEGVLEFYFRVVDFATFALHGNYGSHAIIFDLRNFRIAYLFLGQSVVIRNLNSSWQPNGSILGEYVRVRIFSTGNEGGMVTFIPNGIVVAELLSPSVTPSQLAIIQGHTFISNIVSFTVTTPGLFTLSTISDFNFRRLYHFDVYSWQPVLLDGHSLNILQLRRGTHFFVFQSYFNISLKINRG